MDRGRLAHAGLPAVWGIALDVGMDVGIARVLDVGIFLVADVGMDAGIFLVLDVGI